MSISWRCPLVPGGSVLLGLALLLVAGCGALGGASIVGTWECDANTNTATGGAFYWDTSQYDWDASEKDLIVTETADGFELDSWSECSDGTAFEATGDGDGIRVEDQGCEGYTDATMIVNSLELTLDGADAALYSCTLVHAAPRPISRPLTKSV